MPRAIACSCFAALALVAATAAAGPKARPSPQEVRARAERKLVARHLAERKARVQARGGIFRRIAVDRQYAGEYVLARDHHVTAFLDITDSMHPAFDPKRETDEDLAGIPVARRAHILVVPNQPREHISSVLGRSISGDDVEETARVIRSAKALAGRLGIVNPRVYINAESRVQVGYLHVHIIGERPADRRYPPALQ